MTSQRGQKRKRMPRQRPGASKQDYETPDEFVRAVERLVGIAGQGFAVDLAATEANSKGQTCITPEADSLVVNWLRLPSASEGRWCWLNPPFAHLEPWVAKCAYARRNGLRIACLLPAGVGTNWFAAHVAGQAMVLFVRPRLTFVGHDDPYPKDLILCLYDGPRVGYAPWVWKA
jgi:hypothetical protein